MKVGIDEKIEEWHNLPNNNTTPLHEYLDMTWGEYQQWVMFSELPEHLKGVYIDE